MRAVVQRVDRASVRVADDLVAGIGPGLLVLVGVTHTDGPAEVATMARKIHELRILDGERSIADVASAAILVVSQFTLYGDARKGRRPTWIAAASGPVAEPLVDMLIGALRSRGATVETGRFGADMLVESVNNGPMTLLLDI